MKTSVITTLKEHLHYRLEERDNRFRSWEHCFQNFKEHTNTDLQALHIAFYLASWGMYRASAGLFQKDYTVHREAVEIIFKPEYDVLRCQSAEVAKADVPLILELKDELGSYYSKLEYDRKSNGIKGKVSASKTLISKVIMGTLGCTLGYDRYVSVGLKQEGIASGFSENSLEGIFQFYEKHTEEVNEIQKYIWEKDGVHYPDMKVLDIYFWQLGFTLGAKNK